MLDDFLALGVFQEGQLRRAVLHLVEGLHDHEHDPRHNEEVDDGADERAEIDTVLGAGDGDGEARDIGAVAPGDEFDERVDDVVGQRRDDGGERRADDDADGHVDHVAAVDELFELGQEAFHGRSLLA